MSNLIYHPKREQCNIGLLTVYHDKFKSNQDPYIWNEKYLHSFCHLTQLSKPKGKGQLNFWVSDDTFPDFKKLLCDCVFVVDEILPWTQANFIARQDPIVDNDQAFEHHYNWVNPPHNQHHFQRKERYTLKADRYKSFQPQDKNKQLIDILPFLNQQGISTEELVNSIAKTRNGKRARNSKPFKLDDELGQKLYDYLYKNADIKLTGEILADKYPNGGDQRPLKRTGQCRKARRIGNYNKK